MWKGDTATFNLVKKYEGNQKNFLELDKKLKEHEVVYMLVDDIT